MIRERLLDLRDALRYPTCGECGAGMPPEQVYDPSQRCYVSAWVCEECGHTVYRAVDGEVRLTEP